MNLWDWLILAGVIALALPGVLRLIRRKKNGCAGCCACCAADCADRNRRAQKNDETNQAKEG